MAIGEAARDKVWGSAVAKLANPNAATIPFIPYLWTYGMLMERFLNAPMHLLFHGVVADVIEFLQKFMKKLSLGTAFDKFANKYLSEIEFFRLGWCRVRLLPKANWLAEDILGMARVMPCIYGLFFLNFNLPERHAQAGRSIQRLLNALHVMVSALMSPHYSTDCEKIEIYIKIFLTTCQHASKLVLGNDNLWFGKKGNALSLLNLPEQIKKFGPVRWYYEATSERGIQLVKPFLVTNLRKTPTYFRTKLILIHVMKCVDWIKRLMKLEQGDDEAQSPYKGYYRYASLQKLQEKFAAGLPVSAFKLSDGSVPSNILWAAYGKPSDVHIVPIRCTAEEELDELCGLSFASCSLVTENAVSLNRKNLEEHIDTYCILLPRLENGQFNSYFAAVFSDWDVLTRECKKGESLHSKALFQVDF